MVQSNTNLLLPASAVTVGASAHLKQNLRTCAQTGPVLLARLALASGDSTAWPVSELVLALGLLAHQLWIFSLSSPCCAKCTKTPSGVICLCPRRSNQMIDTWMRLHFEGPLDLLTVESQALLVYDVTKPATFKSCSCPSFGFGVALRMAACCLGERWMEELRSNAAQSKTGWIWLLAALRN